MRRAALIGVRDLADNLDVATVLDASWIYGPFNEAGIDVRERYAEAHIPGARFLDLEALSDPGRAHDPRVAVVTPPAGEVLRAVMTTAGVGSTSLVVVTDMDGACTTAPFARYALLAAGFRDVRLLDGGTPAWADAGHALTDSAPRYLDAACRPEAIPAGAGEDVFAELDAVLAASRSGNAQIVDSRAVQDNAGILPDDYAGLAIPAAAVVPSVRVVEDAGAGQRFRRAPDLARIFGDAGVDPGRPKITTCYFGLGSAVVATAIEIAGFGPVRTHPGSLVEYAVKTGLVRPIR